MAVCIAGSFKSAVGNALCIVCADNMFATDVGRMIACNACPALTVTKGIAEAQRDDITDCMCDKGLFGNAISGCTSKNPVEGLCFVGFISVVLHSSIIVLLSQSLFRFCSLSECPPGSSKSTVGDAASCS